MKHFLACLFLLTIGSTASFSQNVGIGTTSPDPSALLDIDASATSNKGILIPRMTAVQRLAIPSPANSLLVFDTDSTCFFYWNAGSSAWKSLCNIATPGPIGLTGATGVTGATGTIGSTGATGADLGTHWTITGNAGTIPGTNFIGTTDGTDLIISTNSSERVRVTSAGNVGIGNTTPSTKLDVAGSVKITDGTEGAGKVLTSDAVGQGSWTTAVFSEQFTSAEFPIVANSDISVAHGLSGTPTLWVVYARNKVAEFGYAVGDEIIYSDANAPVSEAHTASGYANSTTIGISTKGGPKLRLRNGTIGNGVDGAAANWVIFFRAWR